MLLCLSAALFVLPSPRGFTQENQPDDPVPAELVPAPDAPAELDLPEVRHLAAALSDPASRRDTLLTVAALTRSFERGSLTSESQLPDWEKRFRADRAWLDRLAGRFTGLPTRTPVLDVAAWSLQLELDEQGLSPNLAASPLGPDDATVLRQLFDRADERLAAALLPEALFRVERSATPFWSGLRQQAALSPPLAELLGALNAEWLDPWAAAEAPAPSATADDRTVLERGLASVGQIARGVTAEGPPDALRLKRLRFELLQSLPDMTVTERAEASRLLALATALDGLIDSRLLAFTDTLLWLASDLLVNGDPPAPERPGPESLVAGEAAVESAPEAPEADAEEPSVPPVSGMPRLLAELLPAVSNAFAGPFGEVDPRINASLAAAFDVAQYLQAGEREPARLVALKREVADAVAQLVLLIPDLDYYFEQPVRQRIAEELDICISIVANRDEAAVAGMSREQFDGCLESLAGMAETDVASAELAGDPDGPFGTEQLRRELVLTPWQRVNYVLGYLHEHHALSCPPPAEPLPNPLEWSSLATAVVWFARQSPVYVQTPQNEERIAALRDQGMRILERWVQQVDCISGTGTRVDDPVTRGLADYRRALDDLVGALREAELEFREERLKPGADVVLHGDAGQRTAFRTEGLQIQPCDPARVCEMSGTLESTRALVGLFPDTYLIADQSRLGEVEICYDNVEWVERRSVPVRPDDDNVANYYGRLSFDLVGRYRENGEVTPVFGFRFVSPDEYHYLFAAATEEVLADSCPTEWVGSRIVTRLGGDARVRVVPDRLTYLAAARSLPSQILSANWSRNQEWRDRFVTGLDVTSYVYPPDDTLPGRVNRHLRGLYQASQAYLYSGLLRPSPGGAIEDGSLYEQLEELTARKALVRAYLNLFYPQSMLNSDPVRGALEGYGSLLDRSALRRFRDADVAVSVVNETGRARLERFQATWEREPEALKRTGSSSTGVAHAIARLNALYAELFVLPRRPVQEAGDLLTAAGGG